MLNRVLFHMLHIACISGLDISEFKACVVHNVLDMEL